MNKITPIYFTTYAPVFVLAIFGIALLPLYRYQINQDAITYISIAQKYARADWYNAVNGHAYPLISWILAPFLAIGFEPLLTSKIVGLLIGIITIAAMGMLCYQLGFNRQRTLLCQFCSLPAILYFAYTIVTPDLLLAAIMLIYLRCTLAPAYSQTVRYGILCGISGGFAYLTKSYFLLFFLCHFPLLNCWYYFKNNRTERKNIIFSFLAGMVFFSIICLGWSTAISMKYGQTTSSNQGSVILSAISPYRWKGPDHLVDPPNATAVSIWEDPHEAFAQRHWSPFLSPADFKYWLHFILRNLRVTVWTFFIFSPLGFCICLWYAADMLRRRRFSVSDTIAAYIIGTCAIFAGGYCLLIAEERYLWPLFFLFIILSMLGLTELIKKNFFKNRALYTGTLLLFFLSYAAMPAGMLYENMNTGHEHAVLGQKLRHSFAPGSKLVFDTNWYESLFLTFHLQSQIYGTADNIPTPKLADELQRCAIDYFILWQHTPDEYPFLNNASEVTINGIHELRIFKITQQ